ncbi:MAG: type I-U CRISPR-associated protein Csx17 [Synechococcus sp. SB0677_bin_5]|nr:type I-U CRISPR-associated protein Csx17 [Synechococcus sp. SB0677_bin_5]
MIHIHYLDGCSPTPLAHYLKALGILRLVAEQADPEARGWWNGDRFCLATTLGAKEIESFFLHDYQPTPLVSPWNKGAGFFNKKDPGLSPVQESKGDRFAAFRSGISASRKQLNEISRADQKVRDIKKKAKMPEMSAAERNRIKNSEDYKSQLREAEKEFKQLKSRLIADLQLRWRGQHREWMDAAMVLGDDGGPKFPALLGTGGNDGRFDFTNNFMKRLGEVFDLNSDEGKPQPAALAWVRGILWNIPVPGNISGQPVGQYLPGMAGGANNANGPDADSLVNPLDFIIMLEGTIAFRSSASRRFESLESSRAATPFVVNACGAAYPSASTDDEGARGEQWMPLWSQPSTYKELRRLLAEGRAQISSKAVREPLDLARAVKRLGVARGIKSFQRYGYIERNGQSNLAVPLGRFNVADQTSEHMACIDDLDLWLRHLRREARDKNAPARLRQVEKSLVDALFTVTAEHSQDPDCWQGVLSQLAEIEAIMRQGTGHEAQPVPPLRPEWVAASNDGSPEFRLALAFALQGGGRGKSGIPVDPIRRHWLPLDQKQRRFATSGNGLDMQPEVVMHGRRGLDDTIALVQRRLVEASQHGGRHLPLDAARQASASIADLTALLTGGVDLDRTLALARVLMALDHRAWAAWSKKYTMEQPHDSEWPDDPWLAIRLCTLPWPLRVKSGFELDIGADPVLVRRLATGDATTAFVIASRRLRAAGVRCTIRSGAAPPETARLWAAALAFPITKTTAKRFLSHLDPSKE